MHELVLFLGAGFASDAGLPVMSRFGLDARLEGFALRSHARAPEDDPWHRKAAKILVQAGETYEAFADLCKNSKLWRLSDWNNLEAVMCVAEALAEAGDSTVTLRENDTQIVDIRAAMKLWTWKVYHQLPAPFNPKDYTNEYPYRRLFESISESGIADRLTVITTNYDIVYEYYSWNHGIPSRYPLDWSYEELTAGYGSDPFVHREADRSGRSLLCKLHGSINYFELPAGDCESQFHVASDVGDHRCIGLSGTWEGRPAILAVDAIWKLRGEHGDALVPAIVPPTYAKLTGTPWLRPIWQAALQSLRAARTIVFIGYSLPPSDGFMSAMLAGAMATRSTNDPVAIYVIDTAHAVHDRFRTLFGPLMRSCETMSFCDASRGPIQEIMATELRL